MTDKEVRKLKRAELLEILFYLQKEVDKIKAENENLRQQLDSVSSANKLSEADLAQVKTAVKDAVQEAMHSKNAEGAEKSDGSAGA